MSVSASMSEVAALIGDRARGEMLSALVSGRALTAKELAYVAKITPQTTSEHLSKLVEAGILTFNTRGRFRYFRLASAAVNQMLEGIMTVAAAKRVPPVRDHALARARICYDHLAGELGVAIADSLIWARTAEKSRRAENYSCRNSKSMWRGHGVAGALSAGRAWIGASGAIISPARSEPRSQNAVLKCNGLSASTKVERCSLLQRERKSCLRPSGLRFWACRRNGVSA